MLIIMIAFIFPIVNRSGTNFLTVLSEKEFKEEISFPQPKGRWFESNPRYQEIEGKQ